MNENNNEIEINMLIKIKGNGNVPVGKSLHPDDEARSTRYSNYSLELTRWQ